MSIPPRQSWRRMLHAMSKHIQRKGTTPMTSKGYLKWKDWQNRQLKKPIRGFQYRLQKENRLVELQGGRSWKMNIKKQLAFPFTKILMLRPQRWKVVLSLISKGKDNYLSRKRRKWLKRLLWKPLGVVF